MFHSNRVKCTASLNSSGDIVTDTASPGFAVPGFGPYFYLLEDSVGNWELGWNDSSKASGSQRNVWNTGFSGAFAAGTTGLTCSSTAPAQTLPVVTGPANLAAPGTVDVAMAQSVGLGTSISVFEYGNPAAEGSVAIGGGVQIDKTHATAIGRNAEVHNAGSTALGYNARPTCGGETALGNVYGSSMSTIAVKSTTNGASTGTFPLSVINDAVNDAIANVTSAFDSFKPEAYSHYAEVRVQGTLSLISGTTENTRKVINIDYMLKFDQTSYLGTVYVNNTTLFSGTSAVNITVTVDAAGAPQIVIGTATSNLHATGLLLVSKLLHNNV